MHEDVRLLYEADCGTKPFGGQTVSLQSLTGASALRVDLRFGRSQDTQAGH